jgi:cellulose synthase/poly-beta-1,6-N-acetylglucosamine synthase-like glycosyltransferase
MKIYLVIPAHNEEAYLTKMLQSLVDQSILPSKVIIVNDNSTDNTQTIIDNFSKNYSFIQSITIFSEKTHLPGSKVINAFYKGFEELDNAYNLIGKFDADIELPKTYFEKMISLFKEDPSVGIAGGNLYIKKESDWIYEDISEKNKVRGPIKLYRKECFKSIGGLKKAIGWDTVDGFLAQYYGWKTVTDPSLHVLHLKPTGAIYTKAAKFKQGEAFYKMRYGIILTQIAAAKLAFKKRNLSIFINSIIGYIKAKKEKLDFIVTKEEGKFIRNLRWKGIKKKFYSLITLL